MIARLKHEDLERLAKKAALADGSRSLEEALLDFGHLVQLELERRENIMNRRMGCVNMKGHVFALCDGDGVKEMEYSPGNVLIKWDGLGQCTNCDATLGVTYRENV